MQAEDNNHMSDASRSTDFTAADANRVHLLCTSLFDDVISDDELSELNGLLGQHPEARRLYLRYVLLCSTLSGSVSKHRDMQTEQLAVHIDALEASSEGDENLSLNCVPQQDERSSVAKPVLGRPSRQWSLTIAWTSAAALLLAATAFWWTSHVPREPNTSPEQVAATNVPDHSTFDLNSRKEQDPAIKVSYSSSAVKWRASTDLPNASSLVEANSSLQLDSGEVELTYPCGSKLLLIGPAEFEVRKTGGKLIRGGLVASVTEAGHGFTIDLPNGKVVDLGTEFGVTVDDFGVSGVSVFKGKVEAFPLKDGRSTEKIELNKGDGLQWDNSAVVSLKADLRKFASSLLGRQLSDNLLQNETSITDLFHEPKLDAATWTTLGNVSLSDGNLLLQGQGDSWTRPYLISNQQLDPLLGTVTVTCDVRFENSDSGDSRGFSILTRSGSERGTVEIDPSAGTLSSYVRCSFGTEDSKENGLMSAGVKLETDTRIDGLTLDSFRQPKPDSRYRIVMQDDGVNVTFTVSLIDQPQVSKTVTCRSLFRAKQNHIAFEGGLAGSTIIERVEIFQDHSAAAISSYAEFSSLLQHDPEQRMIEERIFGDWIPTDASLLVEDDFTSEELDSSKWQSLGELVLSNGSLQLGVHNSKQHIDTMQARPHLLTRDIVSTTDGKLTIIGKVTFAENFLAGFGGSFAVATRADNKLGSGPGWENSVLQRGVRANFWPAAWDTKHNLEIHQKPSANTITLLATRGVQVDPVARVYLFRVVDDGKQVSLTLIDPRKPDQSMVIESPTSIPMQKGHVAFESCWGSPVLLDDVKIYRSKPNIE